MYLLQHQPARQLSGVVLASVRLLELAYLSALLLLLAKTHFSTEGRMVQKHNKTAVMYPPLRQTKSVMVEESGAGEGTRTPDRMFTKHLLYQLSYAGNALILA